MIIKKLKILLITLVFLILSSLAVYSAAFPAENLNPYYDGFASFINQSFNTQTGDLDKGLNQSFEIVNITGALIANTINATDGNFSGELRVNDALVCSVGNELTALINGTDANFNNVGIGTTTPQTTLNVVGDFIVNGSSIVRTITDSINAFQVLDVNGGTPIFNVDTTNERVGIGTSSPIKELHLSGTALSLRFSDKDASTDQEVNAGMEFYRGDNLNRVGFLAFASSTNDILALATDYTNGEIRFGTGDNSDRMTIDKNGNVGIGTTTPTEILTVIGNGSFTTNLRVDDDFYIGNANGDQILATDGSSGTPTYGFTSDLGLGMYRRGTNSLALAADQTERLIIFKNQILLQPPGTVSTPSLSFVGAGGPGLFRPAADELAFTAGGIEFLSFDENGVDIATFNDDSRDIDFRVETNLEENMIFVNGGTDEIDFAGGYGSTGITINTTGDLEMNGNLVIDGTCTSEGADCATDIAELMHSKASFDNTTCTVTPEHQEIIIHKFYNQTIEECTYQLVGEFYEFICNNISVKTGYQDESEICYDEFKFAEGQINKFNKVIICHNDTATYTEDEFRTIPKRVDCNLNQNFVKEFESGDVVCTDTDPQKIKFCDSAYDTSVIGVVNYEATMILNQRAPYPVTLAGNIPVKVKCDTAINIGDLLVSSSTAGVSQSVKTVTPTTLAQVWNKLGSPFAKALESCSSGTDTIRGLLI